MAFKLVNGKLVSLTNEEQTERLEEETKEQINQLLKQKKENLELLRKLAEKDYLTEALINRVKDATNVPQSILDWDNERKK